MKTETLPNDILNRNHTQVYIHMYIGESPFGSKEQNQGKEKKGIFLGKQEISLGLN